MFKVGDLVFAQIRGYLAWPAVINKVEPKGKTISYQVNFFGPKKEIGHCTSSKMFHFEDRDFLQAIKEAERDVKTKKSRKSNISSPAFTSQSSSTPKISRIQTSLTATATNSTTLVNCDKSVNTTNDFLSELKNLKLENESLKLAAKQLQEENITLQNKIEELRTSSTRSCLQCFPPMGTQSSINSSLHWKKVKPSHKERRCSVPREFSLSCTNRFSALAPEDGEEVEIIEDNSSRKILICGDSHGRDLSWHLNKARKSSDAVGFVLPGGRTRDILSTKNIESENLNADDTLVLVCGTNDLARNEANEVLRGIRETVHQFSHIKTVIVDIPQRCDLAEWSCVNKETQKTNDSLKQLCEQLPHVVLVEASRAERHLHTSQGLHFNNKGKTWLADLIAQAINTIHEPKQRTEPMQPPPPGLDNLSENYEDSVMNQHP